jgi:hypothetical protein
MIGEWGTTGTSVEKGASWIYFDFFVRTSKVCPSILFHTLPDLISAGLQPHLTPLGQRQRPLRPRSPNLARPCQSRHTILSCGRHDEHTSLLRPARSHLHEARRHRNIAIHRTGLQRQYAPQRYQRQRKYINPKHRLHRNILRHHRRLKLPLHRPHRCCGYKRYAHHLLQPRRRPAVRRGTLRHPHALTELVLSHQHE